MESVDFGILAIVFVALCLFLVPRIRNNNFWKATVTPLASIIGSGFLIAAPILATAFGTYAPYAMGIIVIVALLTGSVIRFNILYAEPALNAASVPKTLKTTETISNLAVFAAYLISVAFYLRLLSAFVLEALNQTSETNANILTTVILVVIGLLGLFKGLRLLEMLEEYSVSIKLSIILALFFALGWNFFSNGSMAPELVEIPVSMSSFALLGGMFLVVQGFETSRYLGEEYDAATRVKSMFTAQIIASVIYILFALLILPIAGLLEGENIEETGIIRLVGVISPLLTILLLIAAISSQFSAAIADTLGGGGIIKEETGGKAPARVGYLIITVGAVILIWNANIFEIVSLASRAFAFYYLTQVLVAFQVLVKQPRTGQFYGHFILFTAMITVLGYICIFAIPVS